MNSNRALKKRREFFAKFPRLCYKFHIQLEYLPFTILVVTLRNSFTISFPICMQLFPVTALRILEVKLSPRRGLASNRRRKPNQQLKGRAELEHHLALNGVTDHESNPFTAVPYESQNLETRRNRIRLSMAVAATLRPILFATGNVVSGVSPVSSRPFRLAAPRQSITFVSKIYWLPHRPRRVTYSNISGAYRRDTDTPARISDSRLRALKLAATP